MPEKTTIGDMITPQKLNILNVKDKETMLFYMRKIVEDFNKLELVFSELDLPPQQNFQLHQLINNNRMRARKVIWGLTGSHLDEEDLKEMHQKNKKIKK